MVLLFFKSKKQLTYHHPELLEQEKVLDYRLNLEELPKWIDVKTPLDIQLSSQLLGRFLISDSKSFDSNINRYFEFSITADK